MEIKHGFGLRAHNLYSLFDKTDKLSTFMNKLEKQSLIDVKRYDSNKYKGDGFEFLVEIFLKSHAYDNRIGITDYQPISTLKIKDNGVDGIGYNLSGKKCVVQIKYKSDATATLKSNEDHLSNLLSTGMIEFGVSADSTIVESIQNKKTAPLHYVITTADGLHHYTDNEFFKNVVHCLGYHQLKSMLDNNLSFWNLCRKISAEIELKTKNNSYDIITQK